MIRASLEADFQEIWLEGEISNLRAPGSGHLYCTLKDGSSQIRAVIFRSAAMRLRFGLEDGLQVVVHGRLSVYEPRGEYQLVLDHLEPKGQGALQLAFEQLKRRLEAEGLFNVQRKRPLPAFPWTVGIVTSPTGAAVRDLITVLHRRCPILRIIVASVQVQGAGAGEQIAAAIHALNTLGCIDVMIVGRGGGSMEDLWSFNEEVVARAIAASRIPVVSGVGHEIDFTIADFVADARAATPTAAAQLVSQGWLDLDQRLATSVDALVEALEQTILDREQRLEASVRHRAFEVVRAAMISAERTLETRIGAAERALRSRLRRQTARAASLFEHIVRQQPGARVERQRTRLVQLFGRAEDRVQDLLADVASQLGTAAARLDALSPLASLGRGYSICRRRDGTVIRSTAQVTRGEHIAVRVMDGSIGCEVLRLDPENSSGGGHS